MSIFARRARRTSTLSPRVMMETLEDRTLMSASVVTCPQICPTPSTVLAIRQNLATISAVTARIQISQAPLYYRSGLPAAIAVHK